MLERGAIAIVLIVAVVLISLAVRVVTRRRIADADGMPIPDALRARFPARGPGIVYFYGPHCGACRQQAPILDRLTAEAGVPVVKIDAVEEHELAGIFRVMTVPTTVIVDDRWRVGAINTGLSSYAALLEQVRGTQAA